MVTRIRRSNSLPGGEKLFTLRYAATYIASLPKKESRATGMADRDPDAHSRRSRQSDDARADRRHESADRQRGSQQCCTTVSAEALAFLACRTALRTSYRALAMFNTSPTDSVRPTGTNFPLANEIQQETKDRFLFVESER
jgi:hypothetical protein